jgi:hypothetical protein
MKINGYDEASCSLLVSFASDKTKYQDPSQYQSYAYQPMNMWPGVTDPTEILQRLAVAGLYQTEAIAREESFIENTDLIDAYKALVGQVTEYDMSTLIDESSNIEVNNVVEL